MKMARKLPWTVLASTTTNAGTRTSSIRSRATKRVKTGSKPKVDSTEQDLPPTTSKSDLRDVIDSSTDMKLSNRPRYDRSPSTSPSLASPPPIELMRPGLDQDDIYVLVEDEFQAIAQSYTAHLHQAEYKRLMKAARERKAEQESAGFDILGGKSIPENVSEDTRQSLKRKLLKQRQSSGVKNMLNESIVNGFSDEDGNEEEEAVLAREERKVVDMWAGTALGGLMSWDHSQEKTSLKGLEKIGGDTRASKGFGPNGSRSNDIARKDGRQVHEIADQRREVSIDGEASRKTEMVVSEKAAPSGLRNSVRSRRRPISPVDHSKPATKDALRPLKTDHPVQDEAKKVTAGRFAKPARSKLKSFFDSFDDFGHMPYTPEKEMNSGDSPSWKDKARLEKVKQEKARKDRLDEVPIFLN